MKKHLVWAALFASLGLLVTLESIWSQAPPVGVPPQPAPQPTPQFFRYNYANPGYVPSGDGSFVYYSPDTGASPAKAEISQIMKQLRELEDDGIPGSLMGKKSEIMKRLEEAVGKFFDEDLKARETELTKLEERLKKLSTQLDRRRKAKVEIIQLQLKVLANEADGLGFSGATYSDSSLIPVGRDRDGKVNVFHRPGADAAGAAGQAPRTVSPAKPGAR